MKSTKVRSYHASHHDVMEMGHHKISVCDVNVYGKGSKNESRETTDDKESYEAISIEHRSCKSNGPLVKGECPIEDLDRRRHCDKKTHKRKDHARIDRLSGDKHVMSPD